MFGLMLLSVGCATTIRMELTRPADSTAMREYSRLLKEKQSLERLKEQLQ